MDLEDSCEHENVGVRRNTCNDVVGATFGLVAGLAASTAIDSTVLEYSLGGGLAVLRRFMEIFYKHAFWN